jgi:hypothetical protein
MMFLNVEILPGLSPYVKTQDESKNYFALLETFLGHAQSSEIKGMTLSELYNVYNQTR